ncbi:hypothetical protein K2173_000199 [Erythroxylum novogranatense]|uniref:non-specific serine/threonine protein kinase n=1 Tax=Erythroxylum novogranatense TaxID=1862640 RepID=A0AAV8SPU5_9ROSI|nr:hypothetical protein K2173_000199 [Erythroxylum novogranatense]
MALPTPVTPLFFCLIILSVIVQSGAADSNGFLFNGFYGRGSDLTLQQVSIVKPSGILRLTNRSKNAIGHAFYDKPIKMVDRTSSSYPNASSFSTSFVFAIISPKSDDGGYGFAFTLSPSKDFPGGEAGHFLGMFNSKNNGNESNHIVAVEFDTVNGFNNVADSRGNHVGLNINGMNSKHKEMLSYYYEGEKEEMHLEAGYPIQAWIDYDGASQMINVTVAPMGKEKPSVPLMHVPINLNSIVKELMYVGFSAATGEKSSSHYIMGWSFSTTGLAPDLNTSHLPLPPEEKESSSLHPAIIGLIVALCCVTVILIVILLSLTVYRRMEQFESLEEWELECPHRFRYRDLYRATKGFKDSEIIGVGGFGAVYKAVMPTTGNEVAVKRITRNSIQGIREFAAEIESLGRLRHKNLVNLQGWCKRKNDLLLVYDYVPNGSLDCLLYNPGGHMVLSWDERFKIIRGIASGLLYLHEEWEQVVIHRDIKPSNVLIDSEMNGRLGDFGLARLYDRGTLSHTTSVVGTIGYIAPELSRTGKASTSSDVFAYGVLLLEVATGKRPVNTGPCMLMDWVLECQQTDRILDVVDPKLNERFVVEEMELVLRLGLLCSHQKPEDRPTMRQVTRYLDGEDQLPAINDWSSIYNGLPSELSSRLSQVSITSNQSHVFSVCSNSIGAGR